MTILLTIAAVVGFSALTITLLNAITGPFLRNAQPLSSSPLVSVMVPVRNEVDNIGHCLESLCEQDYANLEILVLDDGSDDDTVAVIRSLLGNEMRIKLLTGLPLPEGWTGKNWACHQLQQSAGGEILIFCDADTRHHPGAVRRTVGWFQSHNLGFLSTFPQQKTVGLLEQLVIPTIEMFVYAGLPFWATLKLQSPHIAAANGQWIAFTREAYNKIGGHQSVREKLVEDLELSREAKRKGIRILLTAGTDMVFCRMYRSAEEVWEGFSKNIYGILGNNDLVFPVTLLILLVTCVLPYPLLFFSEWQLIAFVLVFANLAIRLLLAIRFKHPLISAVLLHPLAVVVTIMIGLNSWRSVKGGRVKWKGRYLSGNRNDSQTIKK